jgi:hypothetical protein
MANRCSTSFVTAPARHAQTKALETNALISNAPPGNRKAKTMTSGRSTNNKVCMDIYFVCLLVKMALFESKEPLLETKRPLLGKMDLFAQEMRGETIGRSFLLAKKNVIALRQRPLFVWARPPGVIHLGIDPHGGGKTSETAIMAISYTRGHIVVRISANQILRTHGHCKHHSVSKLLVLFCFGSCV